MRAVNEKRLEWQATRVKDAEFRRMNLGRAAGGKDLGCSLYEIPPGGKDWAYHFHHGNEEAIFVLSGEGILQTPDGESPLDEGDYVALPAGDENAHRVHNRSQAPFRFLCMSTMKQPDVVEYPETGRLGVFCGTAPGGDERARTRHGFYMMDATVDYWPS